MIKQDSINYGNHFKLYVTKILEAMEKTEHTSPLFSKLDKSFS